MASQHIFIGPDGNQWIFDTASRSYDLTRGSQHKLVIHTSRGAEVSSILVDPEKSALIIVDMQNFFLHPDCRDNPTGLSTIDPILNVIEKCRAVHMQVALYYVHVIETMLTQLDHMAELESHSGRPCPSTGQQSPQCCSSSTSRRRSIPSLRRRSRQRPWSCFDDRSIEYGDLCTT